MSTSFIPSFPNPPLGQALLPETTSKKRKFSQIEPETQKRTKRKKTSSKVTCWKEQETRILYKLVWESVFLENETKQINWKSISENFPGKTTIQCKSQFTKHIHTQPWTFLEKINIIALYHLYKDNSWTTICALLLRTKSHQALTHKLTKEKREQYKDKDFCKRELELELECANGEYLHRNIGELNRENTITLIALNFLYGNNFELISYILNIAPNKLEKTLTKIKKIRQKKESETEILYFQQLIRMLEVAFQKNSSIIGRESTLQLPDDEKQQSFELPFSDYVYCKMHKNYDEMDFSVKYPEPNRSLSDLNGNEYPSDHLLVETMLHSDSYDPPLLESPELRQFDSMLEEAYI
jgi:hypothetical protein